MSRANALYWAAGILGGTLLLCVVLSLVISPQWNIPAGFSRGDQCEALHKSSLFMEPQNTWSNFGYLAAGLLIILRSRTVFGKFVGPVLCALFLFSGLYHAVPISETFQFLDVASIYWVMIAMIAYSAYGLLNRAMTVELTGGGSIAIGCILLGGFVMAKTRTDIIIFDSTYAVLEMGLILLILFFIGFVPSSRVKALSEAEKALYLLALTLATGLSAFFRLFDGLSDGHPKLLCYPEGMLGFLQAHAVWHILGAASLLITYDYFSRVSGDQGGVLFD